MNNTMAQLSIKEAHQVAAGQRGEVLTFMDTSNNKTVKMLALPSNQNLQDPGLIDMFQTFAAELNANIISTSTTKLLDENVSFMVVSEPSAPIQ